MASHFTMLHTTVSLQWVGLKFPSTTGQQEDVWSWPKSPIFRHSNCTLLCGTGLGECAENTSYNIRCPYTFRGFILDNQIAPGKRIPSASEVHSALERETSWRPPFPSAKMPLLRTVRRELVNERNAMTMHVQFTLLQKRISDILKSPPAAVWVSHLVFVLFEWFPLFVVRLQFMEFLLLSPELISLLEWFQTQNSRQTPLMDEPPPFLLAETTLQPQRLCIWILPTLNPGQNCWNGLSKRPPPPLKVGCLGTARPMPNPGQVYSLERSVVSSKDTNVVPNFNFNSLPLHPYSTFVLERATGRPVKGQFWNADRTISIRIV